MRKFLTGAKFSYEGKVVVSRSDCLKKNGFQMK